MTHIQRYGLLTGIGVLVLALAGCGGDDENRKACQNLLSCATEMGADQAAAWGMAYGDDGSCWKAQSEEQCAQQCKTQITSILPDTPQFMAESTANACGVSSCSSNADCEVFSNAKICDAELKICAGCKTDAECGGNQGACQGFDDSGTMSVACAQANTACYCVM